ncbi:MAG: hypothetical protein M1482_00930 [Chloroflexi bacterium]|nr:hypothetical protein [Chloroflexota bacterium]
MERKSPQYFATSQNAHDRSTREQLAAFHGVDFSKPFPGLPRQTWDYKD